jgi:hypothetical protein
MTYVRRYLAAEKEYADCLTIRSVNYDKAIKKPHR